MTHLTQLSELHMKILPKGAEQVLDILEKHSDRVEFISFVIEKVPLLIIGRHGMIARLPQNKELQKFSQSSEITNALKDFFSHSETLYIFINLPHLPVPKHVTDLIDELAVKMESVDQIRHNIDIALDQRDHESFIKWSYELRKFVSEDSSSLAYGS